MQHDQTWIVRPLNQTGNLRGTNLVQKYRLSFAIGLKDSRVKTNNSVDMAIASLIPKDIGKKRLTACIQKAFSIKQNTDLFSKIINVPRVISSTQYSWLINVKYVIYLDDYKSQR